MLIGGSHYEDLSGKINPESSSTAPRVVLHTVASLLGDEEPIAMISFPTSETNYTRWRVFGILASGALINVAIATRQAEWSYDDDSAPMFDYDLTEFAAVLYPANVITAIKITKASVKIAPRHNGPVMWDVDTRWAVIVNGVTEIEIPRRRDATDPELERESAVVAALRSSLSSVTT